MSILIDEHTRFLIQGITGKQGQRTCAEMLQAGSHVVGGVTPGKGGQQVHDVAVFDRIAQAPQADVSVVLVPPKFAKGAIVEAIEAGIGIINVITENIPVHDMAYCLALARRKGVRIIGPTSIGIYSVGKSKCGTIAGGKSKISFSPGTIGVISKSGGMSSETSLVLTQSGLGESTVIGVGADVLMGTNFCELMDEFAHDAQTEGIVFFGEIGGTCEEDLAQYLISRRKSGNPYPKPLVAFVSGKFAQASNIQNVSLGHAGAIIEGERGTRHHKVKVLKEAGVLIADVHHDVGRLMCEALNGIQNKDFKDN